MQLGQRRKTPGDEEKSLHRLHEVGGGCREDKGEEEVKMKVNGWRRRSRKDRPPAGANTSKTT